MGSLTIDPAAAVRFRFDPVPALRAAVLLMFCAAAPAVAQQAGEAWSVSSQPIVSIGRADGPQEELFSQIRYALRLEDGRYVIADGEQLRLSVWSADGRFQTGFGRAGEGPGEFGGILGVWLTGRDTIAVWDPRLQRITRFRPDGSVVRTDRLSYGAGGSPINRRLDPFYGAMPDGRIILAWISISRQVPDRLLPDTLTFGLFEPDGRFVRVLGARIGMQRMIAPGVGGGPVPFSSWPSAAVIGSTFVYTNGLDGMVDFFETRGATTQPPRTIRVAGSPLTLEDAWRRLDAAIPGATTHRINIQIAQATRRNLGQVPLFARMITDDRGRIWLKDYDPASDALTVRKYPFGDGGRWRIIQSDGRAVATITMPPGVAPLAVHGDELLAVLRDELDIERFVVYRIIRPG